MKNDGVISLPSQFEQLSARLPPKEKAKRFVIIGNFDGAHRGHAALIETAKDWFAVHFSASPLLPFFIALTFEPHPRVFFQPKIVYFRLSTPEDRIRHLNKIGFDCVISQDFTQEFAAFSPQEFVEKILVDCLEADVVVVGEDFHFGKGRAGHTAFLQEQGQRFNFQLLVVKPVSLEDGTIISSSQIRLALEAGDLPRANRMLGYAYNVRGEVIHGAKRGQKLGFPTANMVLPANNRLAHGVYAVKVRWGEAIYRGVASFGRRPQFDNGAPLLETYIFDFSEDLYGQEIEVSFYSRLRGEQVFSHVEALVAQMQADCEAARRLLAAIDAV